MFLLARSLSRLLRPLAILAVVYVLFFSEPARANVLDPVAALFPWPGLLAGVALTALAGLAFFQEFDRRRRYAIREEIFSLEDRAVFSFLDSMCHAAAADSRTEREEVDFIRDLAVDLTGLDYTPAHIAEAIACCDRMTSAKQFRRFGKGLDLDQKRMILRGAMSVIVSDGGVSKAERVFLNHMAKGLGISKSDVSGMTEHLMARVTSPASANLA